MYMCILSELQRDDPMNTSTSDHTKLHLQLDNTKRGTTLYMRNV